MSHTPHELHEEFPEHAERIHALKEGIENVTLGPVAEDVVRRYREDPFVLERELVQLPMGSTAI